MWRRSTAARSGSTLSIARVISRRQGLRCQTSNALRGRIFLTCCFIVWSTAVTGLGASSNTCEVVLFQVHVAAALREALAALRWRRLGSVDVRCAKEPVCELEIVDVLSNTLLRFNHSQAAHDRGC